MTPTKAWQQISFGQSVQNTARSYKCRWLHWLLLYFITTSLLACSVYKSEGRKFLESEGLQFAGVAASEFLVACSKRRPPYIITQTQIEQMQQSYEWEKSDITGFVMVSTNNEYHLILSPDTQQEHETFCYFQFPSEKDYKHYLDEAIGLTRLVHVVASEDRYLSH